MNSISNNINPKKILIFFAACIPIVLFLYTFLKIIQFDGIPSRNDMLQYLHYIKLSIDSLRNDLFPFLFSQHRSFGTPLIWENGFSYFSYMSFFGYLLLGLLNLFNIELSVSQLNIILMASNYLLFFGVGCILLVKEFTRHPLTMLIPLGLILFGPHMELSFIWLQFSYASPFIFLSLTKIIKEGRIGRDCILYFFVGVIFSFNFVNGNALSFIVLPMLVYIVFAIIFFSEKVKVERNLIPSFLFGGLLFLCFHGHLIHFIESMFVKDLFPLGHADLSRTKFIEYIMKKNIFFLSFKSIWDLFLINDNGLNPFNNPYYLGPFISLIFILAPWKRLKRVPIFFYVLFFLSILVSARFEDLDLNILRELLIRLNPISHMGSRHMSLLSMYIIPLKIVFCSIAIEGFIFSRFRIVGIKLLIVSIAFLSLVTAGKDYLSSTFYLQAILLAFCCLLDLNDKRACHRLSFLIKLSLILAEITGQGLLSLNHVNGLWTTREALTRDFRDKAKFLYKFNIGGFDQSKEINPSNIYRSDEPHRPTNYVNSDFIYLYGIFSDVRASDNLEYEKKRFISSHDCSFVFSKIISTAPLLPNPRPIFDGDSEDTVCEYFREHFMFRPASPYKITLKKMGNDKVKEGMVKTLWHSQGKIPKHLNSNPLLGENLATQLQVGKDIFSTTLKDNIVEKSFFISEGEIFTYSRGKIGPSEAQFQVPSNVYAPEIVFDKYDFYNLSFSVILKEDRYVFIRKRIAGSDTVRINDHVVKLDYLPRLGFFTILGPGVHTIEVNWKRSDFSIAYNISLFFQSSLFILLILFLCGRYLFHSAKFI